MAVMKDVAKLAGVSISTVSFVLNGTAKEHKVADSTAKKVLQAARQLGYKINSSSKSSEVGKPWQPTIAFFTPIHSAWLDMSVIYTQINKHMKQSKCNYHILLCPYETGSLIKTIEQVQHAAYDSAVVYIDNEKELKELERLKGDYPFVLYNRISEKYSGILCLAEEAITQAVKMIAAKGYKEIRILCGNEDQVQGDAYLNIFVEICKKNGIEFSKDNFIITESTIMGGAIAARSILNRDKKPELIICMNIQLAFGAIPLLARNRFFIPKNGELLCFGSCVDTDYIRNYIPSLSMITLPIDEITQKTFDVALHLAEGKESKPMNYYYSCELLLHDSFSL